MTKSEQIDSAVEDVIEATHRLQQLGAWREIWERIYIALDMVDEWKEEEGIE